MSLVLFEVIIGLFSNGNLHLKQSCLGVVKQVYRKRKNENESRQLPYLDFRATFIIPVSSAENISFCVYLCFFTYYRLLQGRTFEDNACKILSIIWFDFEQLVLLRAVSFLQIRTSCMSKIKTMEQQIFIDDCE